jgi:hypothetical protein
MVNLGSVATRDGNASAERTPGQRSEPWRFAGPHGDHRSHAKGGTAALIAGLDEQG